MARVGGLSYGWVVVAAGMLMTCVSMGSMFTLAVFLQPISDDTGWSRTGISTADDHRLPGDGLLGLLLGRAQRPHRRAHRRAVGGLLLGVGLALASRATSLLEFQLLFGLIIGVATGAFYAPLMAVALGLVRAQPQPRRGPGLGRHGHGAADHGAVRALADHELRVAAGDAGRRHRGHAADRAGRAAGPPPAGRARRHPAGARRRDAGRRPASRA